MRRNSLCGLQSFKLLLFFILLLLLLLLLFTAIKFSLGDKSPYTSNK